VSLIIQGDRKSEDYNSGGYNSDAPLEMIVENDNIELEPSSRIDFSRFYTVEYNIKVFTVGRIAPKDIERILRYARQALTKKPEARRYVARTIDNRTGRPEYIDVIEDSGSDVNWISQDIAAKLKVNTRATGSNKEYVSYTGARFVPRSKSKITLMGTVSESIFDEFFIAPDNFPFSGIIVGRSFLNTWGHPHDFFPERKETGPTVRVAIPWSESGGTNADVNRIWTKSLKTTIGRQSPRFQLPKVRKRVQDHRHSHSKRS
jgi:hypothetical protein